MQKYRRLGHVGLLQIVRRTGEHDIRNAETKHVVGGFEHVLRLFAMVVQVLAHSGELGTLPRKYKCYFHVIMLIAIYNRCGGKDITSCGKTSRLNQNVAAGNRS